MDFAYSTRALELIGRAENFLRECVYPAEPVFAAQTAGRTDWERPPIVDELTKEARARGLWNLFLPHGEWGAGLSNVDYAPIAELTGRSPHLAPEAMNCAAPDTGNMELLAMFGTEQQQARWLRPLLDAEIRSCFSMTEPEVASSDASNIATRIERDGDEYVVTGRKWWSSGAMSPRCKLSIVMGVSDPDGERHRRHSMILVPMDAPGLTVVRPTHVFGYTDGPHGGHAEIVFDGVRVPATNLLGEPHSGFALAQARLGPGRIHHCMRLIGMAERALDLMCQRVLGRTAFGRPIADQGVVREWIAEARVRIEQTRLLVLKAAWLMDTVGNKGAAMEIAAIKVVAPETARWVIDRAIQAYGAAGVSQDTPLAYLYAHARTLQIADGPDEVHRRSVARGGTREVAVAPAVQVRIRDAAVRLFAERGFDATSVQEIVDAAAVTKGAMYHYFRSKDDLLYEIYHAVIGEQLAHLDRILAAGGPRPQTLRAVIVDLVETTTARLAEASVFAREMYRLAGEPMAALRAERRRYHEAVRDLVARGQDEGTFARTASAETVTLVVFGIVNQLPQWYRPDGPKSPGEIAAELADFVLAGLATGPKEGHQHA